MAESFKVGQAPWEVAANDTFKAGSAPWEVSQDVSKEQIIEEMHPSISTKDRLVIKNFSNSPDAAVKYLQKKDPNLEVKHQNGKYLVRSKGEAKYKVLDPDTGFLSKDFLNDVGDIAYDIADGVMTTAGTAGGALAGFAGGAGIGAVPGAMAGGAASSAASEALRQNLGQQFGLEQDLDGTDIAISGALGAASPLLFGAGAPIKTAAKSAMKVAAVDAAKGVGKELTQEGAEALAKNSSKGLLERAYMKSTRDIAPWIGEKMSGRSKESIKNLAKNFDYVDNMERSGSFLDELENFLGTTRTQFSEKADEIGGRLAKDIDAAGEKVNLSKAKGLLQRRIDELEALRKEADTPVLRNQIDRAESAKRELFGLADDPAREVADEVSGTAAWKIQQDLKPVAEVNKIGDGIANRTAKGTPVDEKRLKNAALGAYHAINEELDRVTKGLSTVSKEQYTELKRIQGILDPVFKDEKTALRTLRNLDGQSQQIVLEALQKAEKMGIKVVDDAEKIMAAAQWAKASSIPLSAQGSTSTSRTIPLAVVGGSLGSLAGYQAGGGYSGAAVGGGTGAALGAFLGGPAAIKAAIRAGRMTEKQAAKLAPLVPRQQILTPGAQIGAKSVWDLMREDREKGY